MKQPLIFFQPTINLNGGIERITTGLTEQISDAYDCLILTAYPSEETFSLTASMYSLEEKLHDSSVRKFAKVFSRAQALSRFCKNHDSYTVIASSDGCIISAIIAKIFFSKRAMTVVAYMHQEIKQSARPHRLLLNLLLPYADEVVAVSEGVKRSVRQFVNESRLRVIYNATNVTKNNAASKESFLDAEDEKYFKDGSTVFLSIGRLTYLKAHWRAIEAMRAVVDTNPQTVLLILGEGPMRPFLENRIRELGLTNNVLLLGVRKNIFPYLARCRALLLMSFSESFGLVIAEALSIGCPVISSDCDYGPREILGMEKKKRKESYPMRTEYGLLTNVPQEGVLPLPPEESVVAAIVFLSGTEVTFDPTVLVNRAREFDIHEKGQEWKDCLAGVLARGA